MCLRSEKAFVGNFILGTMETMDIFYIDRSTGAKKQEKIFGHKALCLLYGDAWWQRLFSFWMLPLFARLPFFSRFYGYLQKRPSSVKNIAPFIRDYEIDATEFATQEFTSFNDFFIRKLKPQTRPLSGDEKQAVLPADGRYLVYPEFDRFLVKGRAFDLREFLQDPVLARRYREGSMVIARLCPVDYHRFHFPCSGVAEKPRAIPGALYSVSPLALKKNIRILSENKRVITEIETDAFGTLLYVEIGATFVGSIHQTFQPHARVQKGEEKGYFSFGGSCLVLFFEKKCIQFDEDLVRNTQAGLETRGHFGQSLGRSLR